MDIPDRREVDVVIISDVHLGTFGCHASELEQYLKSIRPGVLVLNGDIIDGWQFNKRYWPKSHHAVLLQIMRMIGSGTSVYYLTGNHDEVLRRFSDFSMGDFTLADKLVLKLDGRKAWIFHGDLFDLSVGKGKWLAKLGGLSYDYLILLNRAVNWCLDKLGREKISISKSIKAGVKKAVKYIGDFEEIAAAHAIDQGYDYVICGHIHQPQQREIQNEKGKVMYLNSGDWVENLTALEYANRSWSIYQHMPEKSRQHIRKAINREEVRLNNHVPEIILTLNTMAR
jgi:UDP-2,3-diacylglucosamine pyrophosphatase LpxH